MIKVLKSGLHTSIQDLGRFGFRNQGVPVSGAMDDISASFANALLNNHKNDALMEITLHGPELLFNSSTKIVITGAEMSPSLNNESILNYRVYQVKDGDVLTFGKLRKGLRSYLGVQGGFITEKVMDSRSYYEDITQQASLKNNDVLEFNNKIDEIKNHVSNIKSEFQFYETDQIEVFKGPDFELFSNDQQIQIISGPYTISKDNNRMGYQLEELSVQHSKSIITSPVLPGTVQLTPSGKLIILLKDAQTSGGYPRVLQLTKKSISILAQKKIYDKLKFKIID